MNSGEGLPCQNEKCDNTETDVMDSRRGANFIRRRRKCSKCGTRFTTYEITGQMIKDAERQIQQAASIKAVFEQILQAAFTPNLFSLLGRKE